MATVTKLLRPLVDALAEREFLGRRALWGSVADAVTYQVLEAANVNGVAPEDAMAFGRELVAALPGRLEPVWLTVWRADATETMRLKQCAAWPTRSRAKTSA